MDRARADSLAAEAAAIAARTGDLRSQALLRLLTAARPGVAHHSSEWIAAAEEAMALADESGDLDLRVAIRGAGAYAYMCGGRLDRVLARVEEMLELSGGDPAVGAGIVIGCPPAWALVARSMALKEMGCAEEAEAAADASLPLAAEHGDPETESWGRGSQGDPDERPRRDRGGDRPGPP